MQKLLNLETSKDIYLFLYLNEEFKKQSLYLTEKQLDNFIKHIKTPKVKYLNYEFSDNQLLNTKYSKEEDTLTDVLNILQDKNNQFKKFINMNKDNLTKMITNLANDLAEDRIKCIYATIPDYFNNLQKGSISVVQNIDDIWGHSLDLFELLINTAVEITSNFDISKLNNYNENIDLFDALQRLQGRACLISNEILALLRAGFADGAYARCRTLYETMVISSFIYDNGNETAKRYLDYSIVNDLKELKQLNKYNKIFENKTINNEQTDKLEKKVTQLKLQYGDTFTNSDYAWAYALRKRDKHNIKFSELEEKIDFEHMRPFYKSASNNIHTGSSSLYSHKGLHDEDSDKILMGASSFGIETPCDLASHCISIITSNLLLNTPQSLEQQVQILLLSKIREDLEENLFSVEIIVK